MEKKLGQKLLVNSINEVYNISTKALNRSEMLNFGLFAFSLIFCSINIYLVRGSSMAINSKFIAVWILLTMIFAAFLFALMQLWANKYSLWKDKRLLEDNKKTSEKKVWLVNLVRPSKIQNNLSRLSLI